ncbi:MAG: carbohydrate kinase family protein [Treponema sp.]|jgi:sugar/nucleoside kinase (ribokinase family)|nr:carbohydrate kinase family protein [Treponema sp.]
MLIIHGTGCSMVDNLYTNCDFSSPEFKKLMSDNAADGGLQPGKLVFREDFERFIKEPYESVLKKIAGEAPAHRNLGGVSVVSLVHAAQVLGDKARVSFFGVKGDDDAENGNGYLFESMLKKFPFYEYRLIKKELLSPSTDVLSDPNYDNNHGERTFICSPGAANYILQEDLGDEFYNADITAFGGTALLPRLHEKLTALLRRAKERGALTVVNLVYDFHSELQLPGKKWKLGADDEAYQYIDVLLADKDESLKTSGVANVSGAVQWFLNQGTGAVIVTEGSRATTLAAGNGIFKPLEIQSMPVCEEIDRELVLHPERRGDTTGCGDNFAGGVIASLAEQIIISSKPDIRECVIHGTIAGGFACFTFGGSFLESRSGEKLELLKPYENAYREQLANTP